MIGCRKYPEFAGDFRGFGTVDGAAVPMGCPDLSPICTLLVGSTVGGQRGCARRTSEAQLAHIGQEDDTVTAPQSAPQRVLRTSHEAGVRALLALKRRLFKRAVRPASGERSGADPGATRDVRAPCRLRQARRWRTRSVRDGSHPSVPRIRFAVCGSV